ncbi:MAG: NAD(P)-dependent oxidoreductase [Pseudomonadota bacterium]
MAKAKVGIVGVGMMGHGIASNIQKNGWPIAIYDHPGNQPTQALIDNGARAHTSLQALAATSDVVVLCVTGSPEVEAVLTQDNGLLTGLQAGAVVIDCSTAIPSSTVKLAQLVHQTGAQFLDAPMTRTPKEAAEGRLNLIVGGDKNVFESQLPLLESYAENITYAGPTGSGHTLKLLHNYVSLGFSAVLAEAIAASNQSGIDPHVLHEVLAKGGGAGVVLDRLTPYLLEQDVGALRFTLSNSAKDLSYYNKMCDDSNAAHSVAASVGGLFDHCVASGSGDEFVPALISLLNSK